MSMKQTRHLAPGDTLPRHPNPIFARHKRRTRRRRRVIMACTLLVAAVLAALAVMLVFLPGAGATGAALPMPGWQLAQAAQDGDSWCLRLVNAAHPLPEDFHIDTVTVADGERVDARIEQPTRALLHALSDAGFEPVVWSGFRTRADQERIMDEKIASFEEQGYGAADATAVAAEWVAQPGTSEHELGLALDINDAQSDSGLYDWLAAHAQEYGFIVRYPANKEAITGISYEPWHVRYVGLDAARDITAQGVTLEEYLGAA